MKTRVALVAAGAVLISYAMIGVFPEIGAVVFLVAVLVVHDALWMPLVLLAIALVSAARAVVRKKFARPPDAGDG